MKLPKPKMCKWLIKLNEVIQMLDDAVEFYKEKSIDVTSIDKQKLKDYSTMCETKHYRDRAKDIRGY